MKPEEIIRATKKELFEDLINKLKEVEEPNEIYFGDLLHSAVDVMTPQDRKTCLSLIDEIGGEEHIDEGLIDNSSIDRTLITTAYCCLEQELYNCDFIQELQTDLNNETIQKSKAKIILSKIKKHMIEEGFNSTQENINQNKAYEDSPNQIFIKTSFDILKDDFKKFVDKKVLNSAQIVINTDEAIKILTSNKEINQNAVMIEKRKKGFYRVYIMNKDKEVEIRNFFKLQCVSEETGFILSPSFYLEKTTKQYEEDKRGFGNSSKQYMHDFKDKEMFLKVVVKMCQGLTARTI